MTDTSLKAEAVRCPHCGAPLRFDVKLQMLCCDHCGEKAEPGEFNIKDVSKYEAAQISDGNLSAFRCTACGAEMYSSSVTAALTCPYCGNNAVAPAQLSGLLKPDYVIPFAKEKGDVLAAYESYRKRNLFKRFMQPKVFRRKLYIDDVQGIYVPFRLYDGSAEIEAGFVTYDKKSEQFTEEVTGSLEFEKVPADASKRIADDLMDNIEPYDLSALQPFSAGYLPGMLAERLDEDAKEDEKRALERIKKSSLSQAKKELNHKRILEELSGNVQLSIKASHYALLPVWLLTTCFNDSVYRFAMNGQTGKFIGELPMSARKTLSLAFLALILPIVLCMAIRSDFWAIGLTIGMFGALAVILGIFWIMQVKDKASIWDADYYLKGKIKIKSHTEKRK